MAAGILEFITFWIIMFTGKFPQDFFNIQLKVLRWSTRVNASLLNLMDPYPEFGLEANQEGMILDIPYQEEVSRSDVLGIPWRIVYRNSTRFLSIIQKYCFKHSNFHLILDRSIY